ncbi:hypothetical protein PM082_002243 [Marasmius tenuissimus]|nr:hypothetical protein PM082_002243 [Marasmius tenuissimus]
MQQALRVGNIFEYGKDIVEIWLGISDDSQRHKTERTSHEKPRIFDDYEADYAGPLHVSKPNLAMTLHKHGAKPSIRGNG